MIRSTLVALAVAVTLGAPAFAQAPAPAAPAAPPVTAAAALPESHVALARQLLELSGIVNGFDNAIPDIALRIRGSFAASRPEIVKDMDDTLIALIPEIRTRRAEIIERSARQTATLFSEAELREIVAFFGSASGRKYVQQQVPMTQAIMQGLEPWVAATSEFFVTRFREEMRKKGHTV